jgi:hypothetical protein
VNYYSPKVHYSVAKERDPAEARIALPQNRLKHRNILRRIALQKLKGHKHALIHTSRFAFLVPFPGSSRDSVQKTKKRCQIYSNLAKFAQTRRVRALPKAIVCPTFWAFVSLFLRILP